MAQQNGLEFLSCVLATKTLCYVYYIHTSLRSVSFLPSPHISRMEQAKESSKVTAHTLNHSSSEIRRIQSRSQHGSVHPIHCSYGYRDNSTLSHTVQVNSACFTECVSFLSLQYTGCFRRNSKYFRRW